VISYAIKKKKSGEASALNRGARDLTFSLVGIPHGGPLLAPIRNERQTGGTGVETGQDEADDDKNIAAKSSEG